MKIGQRLVSCYRTTTSFEIIHKLYRILEVQLRLIQYDNVFKHNDLYNREC